MKLMPAFAAGRSSVGGDGFVFAANLERLVEQVAPLLKEPGLRHARKDRELRRRQGRFAQEAVVDAIDVESHRVDDLDEFDHKLLPALAPTLPGAVVLAPMDLRSRRASEHSRRAPWWAAAPRRSALARAAAGTE